MRLADRYRLERRVGEGGGGGVYLVRDRLADDATMVLKRLHANAQSGLGQWLVNEFQVLAQLDLPTIARVFDFGLAEADSEDPGGPFFTREFIDGVPLDRALAEDATPRADRIVSLFASAAETLRALHRLGVVHGDLKPANIIVTRGTELPVLIDFGLAHGALGGAERVRGGTLAFMPPERRDQMMAGHALAPDPRADLFALAASLAVVLGVERAGDAPHARITADPALRALFEVATRGTHEDPAQRYGTADDFLAALTHDASRGTSTPARVVLRPEGREHELGTLIEHVARRLVRREGGVSAVALVGDEGSGRSTLLRELTWRAQLRGVQVLSIAGAAGEAPARRLRRGAEILAGEAVGEGDDALVAALRTAASKAPLLVLADDVDHADPAFAAQLRALAYSIDPFDPLLVVASGESVARLERVGATTSVELAPLDRAAVEALCAQLLGAVEPSVVDAVHARSGGSPMVVTELLRALAAAGLVTAADVQHVQLPARARDMALRRVASLAPSARAACVALAAFGSPARREDLLALAPDANVDDARRDGAIQRLADGRFAFVRDGIADALLDELDETTRANWLRRAAQRLTEAPATDAARAEAWIRAGDASESARWIEGAVDDLRRAGLPAIAGRLLSMQRRLDPAGATPRRRLDEAELLARAGETTEALVLARGLFDDRDPEIASQARILAGRWLLDSGDLATAAAVQAGGLDEARDGNLAGQFLAELAWIDVRAGRYGDAAARCENGLARAVKPSVRARLLGCLGLAKSYLGDQAEAVQQLEAARALYASLDEPRDEARVLAFLAIVRARRGETEQARELYERTLERARKAGDIHAMASARLNLGALLDQSGDLASALEHFAAAARLAARAGDAHLGLAARLNTAGDLVRLGSLERARVELDAVMSQARALGVREILVSATGMMGVVRARLGDADVGLGLLAEARESFSAMGSAEGIAEVDLDIADVLLARNADGDAMRASERIAHARSTLGEMPGDMHARVLALDARILLGRGDSRGAQKLLGEAVTAAEKEHQWESLARALAVRADVHRAMGAEIHARRDRERALEVLEQTAAILPPDLRSAFWSVPERVALRSSGADADSWHGAPAPVRAPGSAVSVSFAAAAPTLIAQDQRLMLLLDLSRRLGEEQTVQRVLDQAVRSAMELTNAERGAVLLVGADGSLATAARCGMGSGDDGPDDGFSRSIAETVLIDGEAVSTHNARGDARFADFRSVHELAITAVAAVPLRARGRTLGVMYVENRRRRTVWSTADLALMKAFAEQAAIAVEHARLVEQLKARSEQLEAAQSEIATLLQVRTQELEVTKASLARAQEALQSRAGMQGLVGQSAAMRKVFAIIERVRDTDVPVVIEGESGTGKEMIARAIHNGSARAKGPFVVVHCGAIPETLLESELFGHVKGAFTGADRDRRGLIATAHGGTLLLDEMSEMSPKMQVELLRVLQEKRVRPVGGEREEPVDVRVLAASNRVLEELVREGRFREDLYYRLSVVTLRLPALRTRADDVPALASHFLAQIANDHGVSRKRLSREALARLVHAQWPGNVRQLKHALESAAVLAEGDVIEADALATETSRAGSIPPPAATPSNGHATTKSASPVKVRKAAERQRIIDALEQVNWNKVRAATVLGMPRRTLYRRLKEYGLLEEGEE